jgi:hypothetical protein|tara:strand:+ start:783 stop:1037 length:255 start_codon:yes stop_codon:yes gene_type:complete
MKKIFDKQSVYNYMNGIDMNEKFDTLVLFIALTLSILLFCDFIDAQTYQYVLCIIATVKTFLVLNTKAKMKIYCSKFNEFYNGE